MVIFLILVSIYYIHSWSPANNYVVIGRLLIPYINISEVFNATFSNDLGKEKIDYYHGLSTYYYSLDDGKFRYVGPVQYEKKCFVDELEEYALIPMVPSSDEFEPQSDTVMIHGIECSHFYLKLTHGDVIHEYNYYVSVNSLKPIRLQMRGQNYIFGSHYDEYIFEYDEYIPRSSISESEFQVPSNYTCGPFPGPGYMISKKPRLSFNKIFPHSYNNNNDNDENKEHKKIYNHYLKQYNKKYNIFEYKRRFNNFMKNYNYINKIKSQNLSYKLGVNQMIDFDRDEMMLFLGKQKYNKSSNNINNGNTFKEIPNYERPDSIDWRQLGAVSRVKDQAHCGSCWTYGVAGTVEGTYFIETGKMVNVSTQHIMDCTWDEGNNGCMGGEDFRAYNWLLKNPGLMTEDEYGPYLGQHDFCHHNTKKPFITIEEYYAVEPYNNDALLDAIATKGPISVSVHVIESFVFYKSGVYEDVECTGKLEEMNHIVLAVGYGTENGKDYWLIKNSWSEYWGDSGYMKISRNGEACGINSCATFVKLKTL